jgi:SAM-dependent methyltransferase
MAMVEYVDFAEYYDFDHAIAFDVEFYLDFAHHYGSPILELGCGTGRLVIPLAEAGFEVYGIDLSENMLAVCQRKVHEQRLADRVHLTLADMARFDLPRKGFALAYVALRSFMHLLTQDDQLACLRSVYQHLLPGGYFIVDVIAPDFEALAQKPGGPFVVRREFNLPNGHHVVRKDRLVEHDIVHQTRRFEFRFEEFDTAGTLVRERIVPLYTRYTFRYELQLLLERAGLAIVDVFRDYEKNAYDGTGEIIAVTQRPNVIGKEIRRTPVYSASSERA